MPKAMVGCLCRLWLVRAPTPIPCLAWQRIIRETAIFNSVLEPRTRNIIITFTTDIYCDTKFLWFESLSWNLYVPPGSCAPHIKVSWILLIFIFFIKSNKLFIGAASKTYLRGRLERERNMQSSPYTVNFASFHVHTLACLIFHINCYIYIC